MRRAGIPGCPAGGGTYVDAKVGDTPTCPLSSTVTPPHILRNRLVINHTKPGAQAPGFLFSIGNRTSFHL